MDAILHDLGLSDKPRILVLNKVDRLKPIDGLESDSMVRDIVGERPRVVPISALRGTGLDGLLEEIDAVLSETTAVTASVL